MNRLKLILFLLPFSFCLNSQNLFFDHLGVEDGLSQSTVQSIYQDELGNMWLGTRDGLNRYNGNEIEILRPDPNDKIESIISEVRAIEGNKKGTVFIFSNWGLNFYDIKKESFSEQVISNVSSIHYGGDRLWVAQNNHLCFIEDLSQVVQSYKVFDSDIIIQSILQLPNKELYIGTNKSVFKIDPNGKIESIVDEVNIICLYNDSKENMWIGTLKDGLFCYSSSGGLKHYAHNKDIKNSINNNFVRCITEDDNGNYWIGTYGGLNFLDAKTGEIKLYYHSDSDKHSVSDFSIHAIEKDSQGTLWIGTYFGGVNIINPSFSFVRYAKMNEHTSGLSSGIVSNVIEDKNGNLWICSDDTGLNFFDRRNNTFKHFMHEPNNVHSLTSNALKTLCIDEQNNTLWIGSNLGGLDKLNLTTHEVTRSSLNTGNPNVDNFVRSIIKYKDKLLIGTHNGVQIYDPITKGVENVILGIENNSIKQVCDMLLDTDDRLWFSTSSEIYIVDLVSKVYQKISEKIGSPIARASFYETSDGQMWIGTAGQGLYRYNISTNNYENYRTNNSNILNNYILDIEQTKSGNILLSTNSGLSMFDSKQKLFKNYSNNQFFPFSSFNERSLYITKSEDIVLCSTSGMIIIKEKDLHFEPKAYTVNFCNLNIDNKPIVPSDKDEILTSTISQTNKLVLHESQSVFSVDVFTDNYLIAIDPKIQYMLEGFDKEWVDAKSKRTITYTNLNAGEYVLKVKATDDFSHYETPIRELTIIVKPYFYKTWYAYLFYVLALLGILYIFLSRLFLINSLKYAKYKASHIQEVNESKMRFFVNVSHEIRTPITLVAAQIDYLLNNSEISNAVSNRLLNMRRNADKLKDLITELLDFQKHEQGYATLEIEEIEIIRYLKNILNTFKEYGVKLNVKSIFNSDIESLSVYFDSVQMDKVFYNLLSNAYKFTPQNGKIDLSVTKSDNSIVISISDTGIGISEEEVAKIFSRFYQIGNRRKSLEKPEAGTGIGLTLVRDIVALHHGTIKVSKNDPQGTIFEIELPLDISVYQNDNNIRLLESNELDKINILPKNYIAQQSVPISLSAEGKHSIYIVEDNEDIRNILIDLFSPLYNVKSFADAEQAYEEITEGLPSLVLLDVMLPNMTGVELCSKIKSNLNTLHIPVVLLTAAANIEKKIEGLQQGADDYITKPFNVEELLARCNNLINSRIYISRNDNISEQNTVHGTSDKDKEFIANLESIVLQNIGDVNLSVDILAEKAYISRTALFVKFKEILGIAPNKYILDIRMKKAIEIFKENKEIPVNEVADAVGYYSSSYFIKVFKSYYGITPNEYKKQL